MFLCPVAPRLVHSGLHIPIFKVGVNAPAKHPNPNLRSEVFIRILISVDGAAIGGVS